MGFDSSGVGQLWFGYLVFDFADFCRAWCGGKRLSGARKHLHRIPAGSCITDRIRAKSKGRIPRIRQSRVITPTWFDSGAPK
ncbi:hypothetical protein ACSSV4_003600 [Roseovarius sp. MBR-154]|jgi:hypothetical protein